MQISVGDQHKPNGTTTANPFEETRPRLSEYTAQEIATLQSRLDKQLGPEYISSRPGAAGQKIHYLAAEKVINLANEIFGFNGWSSAIQNIQIDFVDENAQTGKISLGLSVIVRVTLKDGTHHEDIGYGHIENCKGKAAAFEKAKKEGTTDGLKRALRTFGNVLGNCVYDKEYVAKVTKVKVGASKWDVDALHRHPDFVTKQEQDVKALESVTVSKESSCPTFDETFDLGDFDDAEFDEGDFGSPDEVTLPADHADSRRTSTITSAGPQSMRPPIQNGTITPSRPPVERTAAATSANSRPTQGAFQGPTMAAQRMPGIQVPTSNGSTVRVAPDGHVIPDQQQIPSNGQNSSSPGIPPQHFATNAQSHAASVNGAARPSGFYSARAAEIIDAENKVVAAASSAVLQFNPHAESPSIRKTAGVDHKRSVRVTKDIIPETSGPPKESLEPNIDQTRRLAMPGQAAQSPLAKGPNTSAYRPPTRRSIEQNISATTATNLGAVGGVDRALTAPKRSPLIDVSNLQHNVTVNMENATDAKRQKVTGFGGARIIGEENSAL